MSTVHCSTCPDMNCLPLWPSRRTDGRWQYKYRSHHPTFLLEKQRHFQTSSFNINHTPIPTRRLHKTTMHITTLPVMALALLHTTQAQNLLDCNDARYDPSKYTCYNVTTLCPSSPACPPFHAGSPATPNRYTGTASSPPHPHLHP